MNDLRQAAQQALEMLEELWHLGLEDTSETQHKAAIDALRAALAEPEQEPAANKQMLRWVEHLKRLSDDGQHMSIPGLSSGACWELAIELEQFIKNTAPTPRKPQTTHWEGCEAVHPECKAKTELERKSDAIQRLWKERDELRSECRVLVRQNGEWQELTAELVQALQGMIDCCPETRGTHNPHLAMARAALAKVEASND